MGFFDFFRRNKKVVQVSEEDRQQFAEEMSANAGLLVKQFRDDTVLDFSVHSLYEVDQIIEDSVEFYKKADSDTKRKMIIKIGAYVFEVARTNFGGQYYWYDRLEQPVLVTGQPEFEMSLLAYEKVKGRFENGQEDNIPFFFEGYVRGVKDKASQMIV
ncbi:hypothetical protein D0T84_14185 [Dysgonomonas sp. 521]|uniref:hypothetical protein n=1 Tax=Dysgonomonas sp. 521 TaxID=2302932 RepID=UPI0013D7294B|nr:hypothetical protein [Dysgonomonas sp. 521]NDV96052.1 hypothetical protein [Dysgonomonas sp. 521]